MNFFNAIFSCVNNYVDTIALNKRTIADIYKNNTKSILQPVSKK